MTGSGDKPGLGNGVLQPATLREAALKGVRWVALGRVAAEVLALGSAIVLARLLAPADFGKAAVPMFLIVLATALTASSFATPLVQRKDVRPEHVRTSVLLSLLSGALLTAICAATAPLLSPVFGEEIAGLVRLMSPVFLVSAIGLVPHALLQRSLEFGRISSIEVASIVVRAAASIGLAVVSPGAEALVLGALLGSAAYALLLLAFAPRYRPGWDRQCARELLSFGAPTAMVGIVSQTNRNLDYLILATRLPAAQVGIYWRAFQLGVEYERKISTVMMRMAMPVFSRTRNLADMRRIRVRMMRTNITVIFGVLAAFVAVAPVLVPFVFGPQWEASVLPSQILAVAGMAAATNAGAGQVVLAAGKPRPLLYLSIAFFVVYGAAVYLSAPEGLIAVCVVGVIVQILRTLALHYFLLDRLVGIPFGDLRHEVTPATVAATALVAVAWPLVSVLDRAGTPALLTLALTLPVAVAIYVAVLRVAFPATWSDITMLVERVVRRRARKATPVVAAAGASGA